MANGLLINAINYDAMGPGAYMDMKSTGIIDLILNLENQKDLSELARKIIL
jgi:hypothetical protein